MPKKWYPVVDYKKCNNCGFCIDLCAHGVYEKTKSPTPVVLLAENCVEGCKYCGVMCSEGAIKYFDNNNEYKCGNGHFCWCCL